jgi:hypothetical protein
VLFIYLCDLLIVFADIIQAITAARKSEQPSKGDIGDIIAEVSITIYLIIIIC